MTRLARVVIEGVPHHVTQRGGESAAAGQPRAARHGPRQGTWPAAPAAGSKGIHFRRTPGHAFAQLTAAGDPPRVALGERGGFEREATGMEPMRRRCVSATLAVAGAAMILAVGCAGQPLSRDEKVEMLMARSASLEDELLATRQRLAELEGSGRAVPAQVPAEDPFRAVAVRFGKFTGGLAADGRPGDQRLKVIIEPLDAEGDVVKRTGSLDLEAFELAPGGPRTLAGWTWTRQEFAKTWLSGLGLYAYVLKLDWPGGKPPASDRVLLRARFTTLSGEVLSAEQEITLRRRTP